MKLTFSVQSKRPRWSTEEWRRCRRLNERNRWLIKGNSKRWQDEEAFSSFLELSHRLDWWESKWNEETNTSPQQPFTRKFHCTRSLNQCERMMDKQFYQYFGQSIKHWFGHNERFGSGDWEANCNWSICTLIENNERILGDNRVPGRKREDSGETIWMNMPIHEPYRTSSERRDGRGWAKVRDLSWPVVILFLISYLIEIWLMLIRYMSVSLIGIGHQCSLMVPTIYGYCSRLDVNDTFTGV